MPLACEGLSSAADKPVALEVTLPKDTIAVGDTLLIHVKVLNRSGDSIPSAVVTLVSLNDTLDVDNSRVAVIGKLTGHGRAIAVSGSLPSEPFAVVVK
jgi:hypothetical protein